MVSRNKFSLDPSDHRNPFMYSVFSLSVFNATTSSDPCITSVAPLQEHALVRAANHTVDEQRKKDKYDKEARRWARLNRGKRWQGSEEEEEEEEDEGDGFGSPIQWDELGGGDDFGLPIQWDDLGGGDEDPSLP